RGLYHWQQLAQLSLPASLGASGAGTSWVLSDVREPGRGHRRVDRPPRTCEGALGRHEPPDADGDDHPTGDKRRVVDRLPGEAVAEIDRGRREGQAEDDHA